MTFSVCPARGASSRAVSTCPAGHALPTSPVSPANRGLAPAGRRRPARLLASPGVRHVLRPCRLLAGLTAVLIVPALVACGSEVAPDGTAAAPVPTAEDTFPAVTNATDSSAAPVIAPGEGEPPTDLQSKDLIVGTGAVATKSSTVSVHYVGALWDDGKMFDSSRESGTGQPLIFPLDQVIPGFAQGVEGMKVGGRRELVIPPALGYGPQGGSPPLIAADDTLVFVVDLIDVQTGSGGAAGTRP